MRADTPDTLSKGKTILAFDPAEIRNIADRASKAREQIEPRFALLCNIIIDRHILKKGINRRTQSRKRRHRILEPLFVNSGGGFRGRIAKRVDELLVSANPDDTYRKMTNWYQ